MSNIKDIIGQDSLVKDISNILDIFAISGARLRPHFLLVGSSGSGKTFTVKTIVENYSKSILPSGAKKPKINFVEINAAQITKEGTGGLSMGNALRPLLEHQDELSVIFVDEFDKLFISDNEDGNANEITIGVQNEFLKVLEGGEILVYFDYGKYKPLNTTNMLFIFSGAFNGNQNIDEDKLRKLGVKTEFLGRVNQIFKTKELTVQELVEILNTSKELKTYLDFFPDKNEAEVKYKITEAILENFNENEIGARLVSSLINKYFIRDGNLD